MSRIFLGGSILGTTLMLGGGAWASGSDPSRRTPPSAEQASEPGSSVLINQDATRVSSSARAALGFIDTAQQQLGNRKTSEAQASLKKAIGALEPLYLGAPGANASQKMGQAQAQLRTGSGPVDFAPIMSSLEETRMYVDPQVMVHAKQAQDSATKGDKKAASDELRMAQDAYVADVALLPVEDAYARVRGAQSALTDGNVVAAQHLLSGVSLVFDQLQVTRPLLGVRTDVAAAADAAQAGRWPQAHDLLMQAGNRIQALKQDAEPSLASKLQGMGERAQTLAQAATGQTKPQVTDIQHLGQDLRNISRGSPGTGGSGTTR